MKKNQRTIKIYDSSHRLASQLSARFGVSMSALVEILLRKYSDATTLDIHAVKRSGRRANVRTALAGIRQKAQAV